MTDRPPFRPRALGEIAIRCADIRAMADFYENVIGLRPLSDRSDGAIVFFDIGPGFGGHTSVLALFRNDVDVRPGLHPSSTAAPATGAGSSLHHLALSLPFSEQDAVMRWYDTLGQPYRVEIFDWIGWRGIFTQDPEGNTVELVTFDASLLAEPSDDP
ncbi:MAG: VOC family protein [Pseudomonadota bacterium]